MFGGVVGRLPRGCAAVAWMCVGTISSVACAVDFQRDVVPILVKHCLECHNATESSGGLDLTRGQSLRGGGDSGPAIDRDHPEESLLVARIAAAEMPPEKNGQPQPLAAADIETLKQWIDDGAVWPDDRVLDRYEFATDSRGGRDWWSLQPPTRPEIPAMAEWPAADATIAASSQTSPIDRFIGSTLAQHQMEPSPPAAQAVLLRRLYYDLIGLPPTADEVDQFLADLRPDAYERVVDRLLARPRFGERWARYWLDVVRYAETNGYERDAVKPHAWRYRDWVIDAFNCDMPYDQFVIEQLAGDEVANRRESTVIATGFLRLGTWDDEPNDPLEYQYERLEDMVHVTSTAFLGLTVKCARCHDHKFDPIPQTDYYRIAAAFWAGPIAHRKREWNGGPTAEELGYDVLGWTDLSPTPPELHLLRKGDVHRPAGAVAPGSLTATAAMAREFTPPPTDAKTSHRRLQLAEWIVERSNPLAARVMVNRLWLHLFGEGLVRTPDNFGFQGEQPTHPALLDWLACEFRDGQWQIKRMLKIMVMSATYRQSSLHPRGSQYAERDPANQFWWRANRRRLDAEALRDSILAASGRLDLRAGGESFKAPINQEALEGLSMKAGAYQASPPTETSRRSVYMFIKRSLVVPLMTVFDTCDTTAPAGRRDVTTVAPQALTLLNNETIRAESRAIAQGVVAGAEDDVARAALAWRKTLGRTPSESELRAALRVIGLSGSSGASDLDAWTEVCHVLVNTNEFIYVD